MFGVVLWSDNQHNRAVIWCEDHGDLAFFNGDTASLHDGLMMDPGDLVQFDLKEDNKMRMASNPKLVASEEYPTLAKDLRNAGEDAVGDAVAVSDQSAKIIAFEPPVAVADDDCTHRRAASR